MRNLYLDGIRAMPVRVRRIFIAALIACGVIGMTSVVTTPAAAQNAYVGCAPTNNACLAVQDAAARPNYTGPLAPTTEPEVCVFVLADAPTALELYDGPYQRNPANVAVILTWRVQPQFWKPWVRDPSLWVREICIPDRLLQGRSAVVLCNGLTRNNGNHSEWSSENIGYLLSVRSIGENDPASLLGRARSAQYGL